jgi:hypothetical protein
MQRAHGGAGDAAAAATVVAPLLQLRRAAQKAEKLARFARAVELYERALAAAELALPRDSLVNAALLDNQLVAMNYIEPQATATSPAAAARMEVKLRSLSLLHARWQAGTLFSPTADEAAYFVDEYPHLPAQVCGAFFYIIAATNVARIHRFLPPRTPAEAEARLHAVYGALGVALETDARGMLERDPRTGQAWPAFSLPASMAFYLISVMHNLVTFSLSAEAGLLLRLRATCGLTAAEELALRRLAERHKATAERVQEDTRRNMGGLVADHKQTAAVDAARHGLRRCALPSCDAQEAHPKLFKLCGRCRGAAYCCAAHCVED